MNVFRDRDSSTGKPRGRWRVEFRDLRGVRQRVTGFRDRKLSEELGRKIERLVACRVTGESPPPELSRWVVGLPPAMRERLVRLGVLDQRDEERRRAGELDIKALLERWGSTMRGRGRSEKHVALTLRRAGSLLRAADVRSLAEFDPARIEDGLRGLSERLKLRKATQNYYLAAVRALSRWAWQARLCAEDQLRGLRPVAVTDRRQRGALTEDEVAALLWSTAGQPELCGLSGRDRSLLYRVAVESGLRAGEIRSLRVASFDVADPERATVRVEAAYSKHRREDVVPLRLETAELLTFALRGRAGDEPMWPLPASWRSAAMLRADLAAAGIPYRDAAGRPRDFHSLRATTATLGARAGVPPGVLQRVLRHSSPTLTLGIYAKLGLDDTRAAVSMLPDFTARGAEAGHMRGRSGADRDERGRPEATRSPAQGSGGPILGSGGGTRTPDTRIMIPARSAAGSGIPGPRGAVLSDAAAPRGAYAGWADAYPLEAIRAELELLTPAPVLSAMEWAASVQELPA